MNPTPTYILTRAALHTAAPGVLDVIFGPDGDFPGAPLFSPPLSMASYDGFIWPWLHLYDVDGPRLTTTTALFDGEVEVDGGDLDLRVPTVAARLAGLCARAGYPNLMYQDNEVIAQARYGGASWNDAWAARLAALTLILAPQIATLKETTP